MKTDINQVIFSRTRPEKKKLTIENLGQDELLAIKPETVKRIIKESGMSMYRSRNKRLRIPRACQTGNSWNSTIESWSLIEGRAYVDFYIQYENTDTSTSDTFDNFICRGEYPGQIRRDDRHGNPRTYYFTYDEADKARTIRSLLHTYIQVKYRENTKEAPEHGK